MRKCYIITLRSVFVQGIRALDTLSPYIYYELLIIFINNWLNAYAQRLIPVFVLTSYYFIPL